MTKKEIQKKLLEEGYTSFYSGNTRTVYVDNISQNTLNQLTKDFNTSLTFKSNEEIQSSS